MRTNRTKIALTVILAVLMVGAGQAQAGRRGPSNEEHRRYEERRHSPQHGTRHIRVTEVRTWSRCDSWSRPPWWGRNYPTRPPRPTRVYVTPSRPRYQAAAYRGDRAFWGSLIGGATGGILGSHVGGGSGRTAAIIGGTVLGLVVGGNIGHSMDVTDRLYVEQTLESVPTRSTTTWRNPDTQVAYEVTPTTTYESPDGRYCREYTTTATVAGDRQQIYGTACRQPDGSWEVVN